MAKSQRFAGNERSPESRQEQRLPEKMRKESRLKSYRTAGALAANRK